MQVLQNPPSFATFPQLRSLVQSLPQPPRWRSLEITVPEGKTNKPIVLYYRDGLECFRYLFSHPIFQGCMDFAPRRVWTSEDRTSRLYSEIMTGDFAWRVQVWTRFVGYKLDELT